MEHEIKIEKINNFLKNRECSDFRIEYYDGNNLSLVGSFDLCYYHEIEIVFFDVYKINMETGFSIDNTNSSFKSNMIRLGKDDMIEVVITDNSNAKQSIICEGFDCVIETVKHYDGEGNSNKQKMFEKYRKNWKEYRRIK